MISVEIKVLAVAARHVAELMLDQSAVSVVQVSWYDDPDWRTVTVEGELTADDVDELISEAGWDGSVDSVDEV